MKSATRFTITAGCAAVLTACGALEVDTSGPPENSAFSQPSSTASQVQTWFVVDDEDPGFQLLSDVGGGYPRAVETWTAQAESGTAWWSGQGYLSTPGGWANESKQVLSAIAVWTADVPAGRYDVFVKVHPRPENTSMATYCIALGPTGRDVQCHWVDQQVGDPGWKHLAIVDVGDFLEVWLDPGATFIGSGAVVADAVAFRRIATPDADADSQPGTDP